MESPEAGLKVLAHARMMDYKPATALLTTHTNGRTDVCRPFLIKPEDLPELLSKVADLISRRAARMVARQMRQRKLDSVPDQSAPRPVQVRRAHS